MAIIRRHLKNSPCRKKRGKQYLDRDSLMDEWGKPFRYDLRDRHPTTDNQRSTRLARKGK